MKRPIVVVALLLLSLPVASAAWNVWAGAFPALPCMDGWAACLVDGRHLGGGTTYDAAGRPLPADSRVGWFDLEPAPGFSPFSGLSDYGSTPALPEVPAVAAAAPVGDQVPPPVGNPAQGGPASPAPAAGPDGVSAATPGAPPPVGSAPPVAGITPPATDPVVADVGMTQPEITAVISTPPTPKSTACSDLSALEPAAMLGSLPPDTTKCVAARIEQETTQTTRDKLSRILILNAEAKGDKADWERLVKRHLEDIDRSDPDLCFKYALYLSRGGVGRALGVIRWSETALENKHRWEGATYKKRVFDLHRLRAEAANRLWSAAEEAYTSGDHTPDNEAKAEKYRGMAKDFAREWLDYASASAQDTKNAMAIRVSAAGNRAFCEGG